LLFTQPFYALGGYSADVAQLQNVFWLAVILGLTFVYGWRFYGAWVALLALTIVAFLPMLASMTRMFYIESFVGHGHAESAGPAPEPRFYKTGLVVALGRQRRSACWSNGPFRSMCCCLSGWLSGRCCVLACRV
jgi:hypothetical protein